MVLSPPQPSVKVYYFLDNSTLPYKSEMNVHQDDLTLGAFKKVFNRKGYKYYQLFYDPCLKREVKIEISDEQQKLNKSANGLFELLLCSNRNTVGDAEKLPVMKKRACKAEFDNKKQCLHASAEAPSSLVTNEIGREQTAVSMAGTAASDIQTLISKRAGEKLAEYNSTSEDPYNRTSISSSHIGYHPKAPIPSAEREIGDTMLYLHRQKHKRKPHIKAYVPSTISSESESSYSLPRIEEIKIHLNDANLGIAVASQEGLIFIYDIQPGSAAEKCGKLDIGDQIIQVDGVKFDDLNEKQALELLKGLCISKKTIKMFVAKRRMNLESSTEQKTDPLSLLSEKTELDINKWVVESAKQCSPIAAVKGKNDIHNFDHPLIVKERDQQQPSSSIHEMSDDEERAAYLDRRNGIGAFFVAQMKNNPKMEVNGTIERMNCNKIPIAPGIENAMELNGNKSFKPMLALAPAPSIRQPLHVAMSPETILKRAVEPGSGLQIKDRKWLKIRVPMSFIGDELIEWLVGNVQGIGTRKKARRFASELLKKSLIKHVVKMNSFNEKCYYVFHDDIIAGRLNQEANRNGTSVAEAIGTNNKGKCTNGKNPAESTTEITYMSNPTCSTLLGPAQQMILQNNPKYACGPRQMDAQKQLITGKILEVNNNDSFPKKELRMVNPPKNLDIELPVWPISPILGRTDFVSERTQSMEFENADYASMIQGEINCGAQFDALDGSINANENEAKKKSYQNIST